MAKNKQINEKNVTFAKGGKTPMFKQQHAGTPKPGVSGHEVSDEVSKSGGKFARGGDRKETPHPAKPARAGCSAPA